ADGEGAGQGRAPPVTPRARNGALATVEFSVVIATRARPRLLRSTLESLLRCEPRPHELVVVDGDPAGSAEAVVAEFSGAEGAPQAWYARIPPGASSQRNHGLELATGEVVVFADDDVVFDPAVFKALARAYDDPSVVGATGRVVEPRGHRRFG